MRVVLSLLLFSFVTQAAEQARVRTSYKDLNPSDSKVFEECEALEKSFSTSTEPVSQEKIQTLVEKAALLTIGNPNLFPAWLWVAEGDVALDNKKAALNAARNLLELGAADSNNPEVLKVFQQVQAKGWFDKAEPAKVATEDNASKDAPCHSPEKTPHSYDLQDSKTTKIDEPDITAKAIDVCETIEKALPSITDPSERKGCYRNLGESAGLLTALRPGLFQGWLWLAEADLNLDYRRAGTNAIHKLIELGALDSHDPQVVKVFEQVQAKGWLDKEESEDTVSGKATTKSNTKTVAKHKSKDDTAKATAHKPSNPTSKKPHFNDVNNTLFPE